MRRPPRGRSPPGPRKPATAHTSGPTTASTSYALNVASEALLHAPGLPRKRLESITFRGLKESAPANMNEREAAIGDASRCDRRALALRRAWLWRRRIDRQPRRQRPCRCRRPGGSAGAGGPGGSGGSGGEGGGAGAGGAPSGAGGTAVAGSGGASGTGGDGGDAGTNGGAGSSGRGGAAGVPARAAAAGPAVPVGAAARRAVPAPVGAAARRAVPVPVDAAARRAAPVPAAAAARRAAPARAAAAVAPVRGRSRM